MSAALLLLLCAVPDPFAGLPNVVEEVPVAGELRALDTPVKAKAFRVKMSPLETLRWVEASFRRAQLYVPPPERQFQLEGAPQLTGYDGPAKRSYTAIFKANRDGTTTLIAGTADLSGYRWASAGTSLPVMPTGAGALESRSEQGLVLSYTVRAQPEEVDSFYAAVLPEGGWAPGLEPLTWVAKGRVLSVTRERRAEGRVAVTLIERGAPSR